jgi:lysophospholipase L1-like esterase
METRWKEGNRGHFFKHRSFGWVVLFTFLLFGCGGGSSSEDNGDRPTASAAANPVWTTSGSSITLDGSGSSDADGTISSYVWSQDSPGNPLVDFSGNDVSTPGFALTAPLVTTATDFTFRLTITDNDGNSDASTILVTIAPPIGSKPTAAATVTPTATSSGGSVTLDGSASSDSDGTISSYVWSQASPASPAVDFSGDDTTTSGFTFSAPTVTSLTDFTFRLTVTDNDGNADSSTVQVSVNRVNTPPVASAGPDQIVSGTAEVSLDGSASTDSDGSIVSYQWTQTSGDAVTLNNDNTQLADFTAPDSTGELVFTLTVEDDRGATASDTVSVYGAAVIYEEDFSSQTFTGWNLENDISGLTPQWSAGTRRFEQGNYLASIPIAHFQTGTSYHIGAYAEYTSGSLWSDYHFSVDLLPLADSDAGGYPQGNDVGVLFGYEDTDNYYRFSMSARQGFSRLEKKEAGVFRTLRVDARGYEDGQVYTVGVQVQDNVIFVYLDGDPLFAYKDSDTTLISGTIGLYCQDQAAFDNVVVTDSRSEPQVVIASPAAYTVATTGSDDTVEVTALVNNAPTGAVVVFTIDGGGAQTDTVEPFTASFSGVSRGEHVIDAQLVNDSDQVVATDTNDQVGVRGDYFLTIGDSITNGRGDLVPSNNQSTDGRIIASQGYQADLSDQLTTSQGYPQVLYNEGVGGDNTDKAANRIASILERHPGANKALVLLGTNDGNEDVTGGTFINNLDGIVDVLTTAGLTVWVARIPRIYVPDDPWKANINTYNGLIDSQSWAAMDGPDLFEALNDSGYFDTDGFHPNDQGYGRMADAWRSTLD